MAEDYVTKSISIPKKVADRVAEAAERDRRNFSNMVSVLCEAALMAEDAAVVQVKPGDLDG